MFTARATLKTRAEPLQLFCALALSVLLAACGGSNGGHSGVGTVGGSSSASGAAAPPPLSGGGQRPIASNPQGGDISGGGDLENASTNSAWFVAPGQPIRVCLERAPQYVFSDAQLRASIDRAFGKWKSYVQEKKLRFGTNVIEEDQPNGKGPILSKLGLIFDLSWMDRCDGTEELKFYFGTSAPEVTQSKRQYESPLGFAHRSSYNELARRGKGFVWIADGKGIRPRPRPIFGACPAASTDFCFTRSAMFSAASTSKGRSWMRRSPSMRAGATFS